MLFQIRRKLGRILPAGGTSLLPASRACFNQGASFRGMKMIAALRRMLPDMEKRPVATDHASEEQPLFIVLQWLRVSSSSMEVAGVFG